MVAGSRPTMAVAPAPKGAVQAVAFSRDGHPHRLRRGDRAVRIWDAVTSRQPGEPTGHTEGVLTALAAVTERIALGFEIVNSFWRHPSLIAMEAATADEVGGGRLRLGLGAALRTFRALGAMGQCGSRSQRLGCAAAR